MKRALAGILAFIERQSEESRRAFVQTKQLEVCRAEQQYWGNPYDERYLVLSFPGFEFALTDLLVLSRSAVVDDDGTDDVIDVVDASRLRDRTWLTTYGLSGARGDVHLHFYFVGSDSRIHHTSRTISLQDLPSRPAPEVRDGVVVKPHPRVPPTSIPHLEVVPTAPQPEHRRLAPAAAGGAAPLPYSKIFLSFDGWTYPQLNCWSVAGAVEGYDYVALSDEDPSSPTDHFAHGWCYVSDLVEGVSYDFMRWALDWGGRGWDHKKWHNANFWTLDLDSAAKMRMWYVRWQDGKWVRLGDVVGFQTSHANWMRDIQAHIAAKQLHQIAIPGTHDSGCFDLYAKRATVTYSQAQNLDFAGQLQYGVRYFDLRLYIANDGDYYFNHASTLTYTKIDDFVSALSAFLGQPGNQEIVIADLSRFGQEAGRAFTANDYQKILAKFTSDAVLGALLTNGAHRTDTIGDLVRNGKRLVLLCDQASQPWFTSITSALGMSVFPSINLDDEWADTAYLDTIKTKLESEVTAHAGCGDLWSLQAQLTPWIFFDSMQQAAIRCNAVAAKWVNDHWWDRVNVVFSDFITGGGLVEVLIECNTRRP